ncbi:MAG: MoaD family protein [Actinomycetota bacterium]|nr:MoaD family protein [Actinomycetota bacterium]
MSVRVKLPTILRKHTGGEGLVEGQGATLREVLSDLESRYPGLTRSVLSEDGGLHRFVNVYVNNEDVRYLGSLETEVNEGDTVSILPAVAGGSEKEIDASQAWFWTPAWQAGEAEASADIEADRLERFDSDDEFLASFDE